MEDTKRTPESPAGEKKLGFKKATIKTGVRAGTSAQPTTTVLHHHVTTTAINCGGGGPRTTYVTCP
jgi:hypothetical protein